MGAGVLIEPRRYGWRYQIKPWVDLGYRVVVPDKLGYGGTDKPEDESEYSPKKIANDIAALMDLLQLPKAVSPPRASVLGSRDSRLAGLLGHHRARLGVLHGIPLCLVASR